MVITTRQPDPPLRAYVDWFWYDQAHFIHEFQLFSGLRPSTYLAQRIDEGNFVPLIE